MFETCLVCGLSPAAAGRFIDHLYNIEMKSGASEVVNHLKRRYSSLLRIHTTAARAVKTGSRVSIRVWSGPFRPIFQNSFRPGRRWLDKSLSLLKLTGLFVAPTPEREDYVKTKVRLAKISDPFDLTMDKDIDKLREDNIPFRKFQMDRMLDVYSKYPMSPRKSLLSLDRKGGMVRECFTTPRQYLDSIPLLFPTEALRFYDYLRFLIGEKCPTKSELRSAERFGKRGIAGRVTLLTKDRALKMRPVANTNRILQLATAPIHNFLKTMLMNVPECFCFDQDAGKAWVAERLSSGHALSSIDITAATDNIPLSGQLEFLRGVLPNHPQKAAMIQFFEAICRMDWTTNWTDLRISWRCGSPMGVHGSYYLFTAWLINQLSKVKGTSGNFAIVGDDLVIDSKFDELVHAIFVFYRVPVSASKSFFKNYDFAEFCGSVISATDGPLFVKKAKPLDLETDYIGKLVHYGPKALKYFTPLKNLSFNTRKYAKLASQVIRENLQEEVRSFSPPEKQVLPQIYVGGFSDHQLYKLGLINYPEFVLLRRWGNLLQTSKGKRKLVDFLDTNYYAKAKHRNKHRKGKRSPVKPIFKYSVIYEKLMGRLEPSIFESYSLKKYQDESLTNPKVYQYLFSKLNQDLAENGIGIDNLVLPYNPFSQIEWAEWSENTLETLEASDIGGVARNMITFVRDRPHTTNFDVGATNVPKVVSKLSYKDGDKYGDITEDVYHVSSQTSLYQVGRQIVRSIKAAGLWVLLVVVWKSKLDADSSEEK